MDATRFDTLARTLHSRRRALTGGAAGLAVLAGLAGLQPPAPARAERCPGRKQKCGKDCIRRSQCCTDGDCPAEAKCTNQHRCQCPGETSKCGDRCAAPEGTPCLGQPLSYCCSKSCDELVDGGTCASCLGFFCSSNANCCPGVECVNSRCGNCILRATVCTPGGQPCCESDCAYIGDGYRCLSRAGGPCAYDPDCATCHANSAACNGICSGGVCQA